MSLTPTPRVDDGVPELEKANILIVDDLPEKLLVFGTVLEDLGQNLVFVRSGSDALREVLQRDFAVILLDVNMPDIDGLETASLIRQYKRSAHTPIIFTTAYPDEIQAAQGYSLGAVDYILSPVVPEILRTKVKVFVELHAMQRRARQQADERVKLAAAEAARRTAEENTRRSNFLAHASRVLSGSLDVGVGAQQLLRLTVPEFAGHAALVMRRDDTAPGQALCCALADAEASPAFCERDFGELPASVQQAFQRAVTSRRRVALDRAALREWPGGDAAQSQAGAVIPMVIGDRALGALIVAAVPDPPDWAALEELASRAAIAFENAYLYRSLQTEIVERREAENKLQISNRRKDEFLAMLSHELRNPLAPIRTAAEVIRRIAPPHPKLVWAMEVTDRQIRHLTRLVEELLDVARISQGKIVLQAEPVDLLAVIAHGVETVRPLMDARQQTLVQTLPDAPVWLRGDFARLSQVVANLLNNAAKYTDEGGFIHVALTIADGKAVISVRDEGIGIDAELLPNVFELFEQGSRTLDRSQGGLGVGLTVVQRLVQLHHGYVQASSQGVGKGAEFRVYLPCLSEVKAPGEAAPGEAVDVAFEAEAATRCRVLVVDDNVDAAQTIAMFLTLLGHEVKTAAGGEQALASAATHAPDVVVLDIGLPTLDGYEVARRLRQMPETRDALLIALTGYGQESDKLHALEAGFDRHMIKPADPHALVEAIRRWQASGGSERVSKAREIST